MADLTVLVPTVAARHEPTVSRHPVERQVIKAGDEVWLVDNGKPGARTLLGLVAELLAERVGAVRVELLSKSTASKPLDGSDAKTILDRARHVVTAVGDCGACTACTIDDTVRLEAGGVCTTAVITEPFQRLAAHFAARLGMPDIATVVIPHPVATRDEIALRKLAGRVVEAVLAPRATEP